jgi:hypothetical protein
MILERQREVGGETKVAVQPAKPAELTRFQQAGEVVRRPGSHHRASVRSRTLSHPDRWCKLCTETIKLLSRDNKHMVYMNSYCRRLKSVSKFVAPRFLMSFVGCPAQVVR